MKKKDIKKIALGGLREFCDNFEYELSQAKLGWHKLPNNEKNQIVNEDKIKIAELSEKANNLNSNGEVKIKNNELIDYIYKKIIRYFIEADCIGKLNLLSFYFYNDLLLNISTLYSDLMWSFKSSKDLTEVLRQCKIISFWHYIKMCICIYQVCDINLKNSIKNLLETNYIKEILSYHETVTAVFSGAVCYDSVVRNIIKNQFLTAKSFEDEDDENPAYFLKKLYLYGFITKYEVERFKEYGYKSQIMTNLLYSNIYKNNEIVL